MTKSLSKSEVVNFSDALIKRYQEQHTHVTQLRDPGYPIRLRFSEDRQKAYWHLVIYRKGVNPWRKVGNWPDMDWKTVKANYKDWIAQAAIETPKNIETHNFDTVGGVLTWFEERSFKLKDEAMSPRRKATIKSTNKCHLLPMLGHVATENVANVLDDLFIMPLQETHAISTVRLAFFVLKAAFTQAVSSKKITASPLDEVIFSKLIKVSIDEKPSQLQPHQLPTILERLVYQPITTQVLVLMMLCHANRIGETRTTRWSYILFDECAMELPSTTTKTKENNQIYLTPQVIALLKAYRRYQRMMGYQGDFLFPGRKPNKPCCPSTATRMISIFSQGEFSAHDFRKVTNLRLGQMGVDYMVRKQFLNHAIKDVDKPYFSKLKQGPYRDAIMDYHQYLDSIGFEEFHSDPMPRSFLKSKQLEPNA